MFLLDKNRPEEIAIYLKHQRWLDFDEEILSLSKPGEGNMNYVLRVTTDRRTFIIKQSRGYVEKYPQVAAPAERVITEGQFYQKIAKKEKAQYYMPKLIGIDFENNILGLEDLGMTNDFMVLYESQHQLKPKEFIELLDYLNVLHYSFQKTVIDDELVNFALRKLNYEHIFQYPFMENNGFDLSSVQEGLQELALPYQKDPTLKQQIALLGTQYLSKGKYLLHGDYYPGSWLKTSKGIKVIDPEFCYYGLREFDLGVLMAHLYLSQQDEHLLTVFIKHYEAYPELNLKILNGFTGVEIMRRLIGLAQLPLSMDLKTKKQLLAFAKTLILND